MIHTSGAALRMEVALLVEGRIALRQFGFSTRRLAYDQRKGAAIWPGNARMAVLVYTCPEEWDWSRMEPLRPTGVMTMPGETVPSLSAETAVQYGFNVGLPRLR